MLFNCLQCGKSVSSKFEKCPYCQIHLSEAVDEINNVKRNKESLTLKTSKIFQGTISGLLSK